MVGILVAYNDKNFDLRGLWISHVRKLKVIPTNVSTWNKFVTIVVCIVKKQCNGTENKRTWNSKEKEAA